VHEEGHRVINERIFDEEAERIARDCTEKVLAKTWVGRGSDRDGAVKAALQSAAAEMRDEYRQQIAKRVSQVSESFDDITRHGANDMRVVDAIEQAFKASTAPAVTERTRPPAPREARSP
jgi:hypothetical protein